MSSTAGFNMITVNKMEGMFNWHILCKVKNTYVISIF